MSQSIRSTAARGRRLRRLSFKVRCANQSRVSAREGEGSQAGVCILTVEALLVHDGAAAQGLVVLLVTHECVHAQDSCGDKGVHDSVLAVRDTSRRPIFHMLCSQKW